MSFAILVPPHLVVDQGPPRVWTISLTNIHDKIGVTCRQEGEFEMLGVMSMVMFVRLAGICAAASVEDFGVICRLVLSIVTQPIRRRIE